MNLIHKFNINRSEATCRLEVQKYFVNSAIPDLPKHVRQIWRKTPQFAKFAAIKYSRIGLFNSVVYYNVASVFNKGINLLQGVKNYIMFPDNSRCINLKLFSLKD